MGAGVADLEVVGDGGRGAGDVGLHPRRRRSVGHDLANAVDRFVGQRLTLVAAQVDLHQSGLAVLALRTTRRQRVAPEVLNVLDVGGVGVELLDQDVVVVVGVLAELLVALEDDHRGTVGVELLKLLPDVAHRHDRGRIRGVHRHGPLFADGLQLG